jgi:hypothetical protein
MNVERIFPEDGTIFAGIQGRLVDKNFSIHAAQATCGTLRESPRHQVLLWALDPSTRLPQTEGRRSAFVEWEGGKNFEAVTSLLSELSGGVGIVVSHFRRHGTIAATALRLKAFHPVPGKFPSSGGSA